MVYVFAIFISISTEPDSSVGLLTLSRMLKSFYVKINVIRKVQFLELPCEIPYDGCFLEKDKRAVDII